MLFFASPKLLIKVPTFFFLVSSGEFLNNQFMILMECFYEKSLNWFGTQFLTFLKRFFYISFKLHEVFESFYSIIRGLG